MNTKAILMSHSPVHSDQAGSAVRLDFCLPSRDQLETAVLDLPHRRPTLVICVPSQLGCVFGCRFCGLKSSRYARNLLPYEIEDLIAQSLEVAEETFGVCEDGWQITFMGQGEPLANLDNVLEVVQRHVSSDSSVDFGISTIGIPSGLTRLAEAPKDLLSRVRLQVSLHAPVDRIRHRIMPGTRNWPVEQVIEAAKLVARHSGRPACLNYVLIDRVNDDEDCLRDLARIADPEFFYVKLSILNKVVGSDLTGSSLDVVYHFAHELENSECVVKVFFSAGRSTNAGCGQLGLAARLLSSTTEDAAVSEDRSTAKRDGVSDAMQCCSTLDYF